MKIADGVRITIVVVLVFACHQPARACTGTFRPSWNSWNYLQIHLSGFPPGLQTQAQTSLAAAMNQWNNNCTQGTIPHLSSNPPEGSLYFTQMTIEYVNGAHPNPATPRVCGLYVSAALVRVYAFQWDGGNLIPCPMSDASKLTHIMAHEIGHRLGLVDSDCIDRIMSRIPMGPDNAAVRPDECEAAHTINATAAERGVCDQPNDCRISPIILSCRRDRWQLTSVLGGVRFDFDGDAVETWSAWTRAESLLGFLFSDLDGSGCVETGAELFGENRLIGAGILAENGYQALDGYDSNRDGWMTPTDTYWPELRLWTDRSHDGVCTLDEVETLEASGIEAIELSYGTSSLVDEHGNAFRYFSDIICQPDHGLLYRRTAWDVYLATSGED